MRGKLAVLALTITLVGAAAGAVSSGPAGAAGNRTSTRSGDWGDPDTWAGGTVPQAGDSVTIAGGHQVTYDENAPALGGMTVASGATLRFAADEALTLESSANVVVQGTLTMRPSSSAVTHTLRFTGVNQGAFVGGGMDPIATDVGLWVMGAGRLDLSGTPKTAWARAAGDVGAGATTVSLDEAATGWAAGDDVSITPTEPPTAGSASWSGFDDAMVSSATGPSVTLDRPIARGHPMVDGQWTAEVLNLTRNVRLEGTSSGKSHVFIRSTSPQTINYVGIRHMGPGALGRYGLHFHMAHGGSQGSQVVGTVVRDTGAHAFVAHMSNGVTFTDTISYNTVDDAYWWDSGEPSEDITYDRAVAALVRAEPSYRGFRLTGFNLGRGENLTIRDSVAVGVQGNRDASGYMWPEQSEGLWNFSRGNIAHNNKVDGIFNWQNTSRPHVLSNFASYYNGETGVDHGAYNNNYHFEHATLYGNGRAALELHAVSSGPNKIRFDDVVFDGGGVSPELVQSFDHTFEGTEDPTVFANSTFRGAPLAFHFGSNAKPDALDVITSTIATPTDIAFDAGASQANVVRLQPDATHAVRVTPSGRTDIAPFASFTDTSPPEASIVSPVGGATVSGNVSVATTSYDNVGISKVELRVNDSLLATSTTAPFGFSWPTGGLASGSTQRLQLRSYDAAGNSRESPIVTVFVAGTPSSTTSPPSSTTSTSTTSTTTPPSSTTSTSTTTPPSSTTTSTTTTMPPTSTTSTTSTTLPAGSDVLSALTPTSSTNGYGPFERDQSNGGKPAGDGRTITLQGKTYAKGLGVHARSELRYELNGEYRGFGADVGVDDECGTGGSVTFEVHVDGTKVFDSGRLTGSSATKPVLVDLASKNQLRLVVTDAGNGNSCDHADWAGAVLTR